MKLVFSEHLFYVNLFQCFFGRSHKTSLTAFGLPIFRLSVYLIKVIPKTCRAHKV